MEAEYQLQNTCRADTHDHNMQSALGTSELEAHRPVSAFLLVGENIIKDLSGKLSFQQVLNP